MRSLDSRERALIEHNLSSARVDLNIRSKSIILSITTQHSSCSELMLTSLVVELSLNCVVSECVCECVCVSHSSVTRALSILIDRINIRIFDQLHMIV